MKKIGIFLAVLAGVVTLASSANASNCKSIADSMQRLACYDKADSAPAPSRKSATVNLFDARTSNAILTKPGARVLTPVETGPRWWIQADGGIYGFSKNSPLIATIAPPASTGPTKVPTAPGFIGLDHDIDGNKPDRHRRLGSFRRRREPPGGLLAGPAADDGHRRQCLLRAGQVRFDHCEAPTIVKTTTSVNTTPDVFVDLFDDTTTTSVTNAAISDQLYGADVNFRMRTPLFANLPNFDVMFGLRYAALNEKLTASVNSVSSHIFQPGLGLPTACRFQQFLNRFRLVPIRNDFIGPQFGFNAEKHWGPFWVGNESKLAVGAMIEQCRSPVRPTTV